MTRKHTKIRSPELPRLAVFFFAHFTLKKIARKVFTGGCATLEINTSIFLKSLWGHVKTTVGTKRSRCGVSVLPARDEFMHARARLQTNGFADKAAHDQNAMTTHQHKSEARAIAWAKR